MRLMTKDEAIKILMEKSQEFFDKGKTIEASIIALQSTVVELGTSIEKILIQIRDRLPRGD